MLPVVYLYLAGMVQGLILVSFPASSAVLKSMHGFTDAQYGSIFLPQVIAAVVGALAGGSLAPQLGLKHLLWLALLVNGLSQILLAATLGMPPDGALAAVLADTACMGLGFGISGAPHKDAPRTGSGLPCPIRKDGVSHVPFAREVLFFESRTGQQRIALWPGHYVSSSRALCNTLPRGATIRGASVGLIWLTPFGEKFRSS